MGSGDWFKVIIGRKKVKQGKSKKSKGGTTESNRLKSGCHSRNLPTEDVAATRIQKAFRAHKARKTLRLLKGRERLGALTQHHSVIRQASTALGYIQSWSRIQVQISARRLCMVTEGRIKQRKIDNQLKIEAKLHDLEVEWCGGPETMEDILGRIQQREEAAVKRERAMAYAFSHQWRANSGQNLGQFVYELGKGNWGWSWVDRWIAARPWETRIPSQFISPNKLQTKAAAKVGKKASNSAQKISVSVKPAASSGRVSTRRLSNPKTAEKITEVSGSSLPVINGAKPNQESQAS